MAKQTGNKVEIFRAYSYRSVLWDARGDLNAAMADADLAIEAWPEQKYGHYWRLVLTGQSGDYSTALTQIRHLEYEETHPEFHSDVAMLEYVAGDRARSARFFRSAAQYASDVDHDQSMAAYYRFNAAVIDSELSGGDLAPIRAVPVQKDTNALVSFLQEYRVTDMPDSTVRIFIEMADAKKRDAACSSYFAIGHKNALAGNMAAAKPAFESAVGRCRTGSFELYAAKKWLKTLGG